MDPIEDNPYGYLKREAEQRLAQAAAGRDGARVVRAWSISGAHVQKPRPTRWVDDPAASSGAIRITARRPYSVGFPS
ncbi:putative nucleoside-diphosphate-sugar epimerase [Mycobacterium ulcerans str. Harvey]|uniref:Nucleoside-diphosphate-sugar epimerase n=1 Tax=Mycobacterium ulcerans str. Harvey TaxID=1299332 RepID=A0ABP3A0N6_MYCUL|nr:putative nucleoside-diphosphate-sugar epimerase [Mycobacterium ulcerans str. Harvey]